MLKCVESKWITVKQPCRCVMWHCQKQIPVGGRAIMLVLRDPKMPDMKPDFVILCSHECNERYKGLDGPRKKHRQSPPKHR